MPFPRYLAISFQPLRIGDGTVFCGLTIGKPLCGKVFYSAHHLGESSGNFSFIALVHTTISVTNVVATNDQYATEMAHLHARAAECRLRVVDSQLSLGFTLCAIAETEIIYAQYDE